LPCTWKADDEGAPASFSVVPEDDEEEDDDLPDDDEDDDAPDDEVPDEDVPDDDEEDDDDEDDAPDEDDVETPVPVASPSGPSPLLDVVVCAPPSREVPSWFPPPVEPKPDDDSEVELHPTAAPRAVRTNRGVRE
jgi:hypothetical protein